MIQTNLKELLNRNNISINKLSIETGLSRPTLTSLMNNESKGIQFDTLEKLLDYFNISISDFFSIYNDEIIFNFLSEVPLSHVVLRLFLIYSQSCLLPDLLQSFHRSDHRRSCGTYRLPTYQTFLQSQYLQENTGTFPLVHTRIHEANL